MIEPDETQVEVTVMIGRTGTVRHRAYAYKSTRDNGRVVYRIAYLACSCPGAHKPIAMRIVAIGWETANCKR